MKSQSLMTDPQIPGGASELGNHRATYKPMRSRGCFLLFLLLLFLFLGAFFPFLLSHLSVLSIVLLCVCVFLALLLGFGSFMVYRDPEPVVFLYASGLVYRGRKVQQTLRWIDVREVRHEVRVERDSEGESVSHTYIVSCTDGRSLTLDQTFAKLQELGKAIEVETAFFLFPTVLETYERNHTVVFGALAVTSEGLYYRGQNLLPLRYNAQNPLPWRMVKSVEIVDDRVIIRDQGKGFPQPLPWVVVKMPSNVEVFGMLVEHISPGVLT